MPAYATAADAIHPNDIKTLFANGISTYFIKGKAILLIFQEVCQGIHPILLF